MAEQLTSLQDENRTRLVRRGDHLSGGNGTPSHVGFGQLCGGHADFPESGTSAPRFGTWEGRRPRRFFPGPSLLVQSCLRRLCTRHTSHVSRGSTCAHARVRVCAHACTCVHVCACVACARVCALHLCARTCVRVCACTCVRVRPLQCPEFRMTGGGKRSCCRAKRAG